MICLIGYVDLKENENDVYDCCNVVGGDGGVCWV